MKSFIKAMDELPLLAKVILAIPVLDVIWSVYRICRSADKKNNVGVIIGIVFVIMSFLPVAIFDIIYLIYKQESVWWMD